ncbi:MAG: SEC-C metal-binding domain-containing protein [Clostridia bacterium]|nr:SEC-C metal-binding domain-containing protein [Clostridia bacterium]
MSLFAEWQKKLDTQRDSAANEKFFENYLAKETEAYKAILGSNTTVLEGRLADLAKTYGMDNLTFIGFLDGINTSLETELDLDALTEESEIKATIVLDKLYYNMLNAKAHWLYELKEWDALLTTEQRADIKKQYNEDHRAVSNKVGRNDPCPCGSGKKYKKCCG